ncbi:hypothetical protein CDD83_10751 [Cordyceps sp. RAO-2017]|nr:hypothetical protein CDD83_10751 [Cordyceps sp. RAO-2017]
MDVRRDADGFSIPATPASNRSRSLAGAGVGSIRPSDMSGATPTSGRSSGALVQDPFYRVRNLALNGICMRHPLETLPTHVEGFVDTVLQPRGSPVPSPDEIKRDRPLYDLLMGAAESQVEQYFATNINPLNQLSTGCIKCDKRQPMLKETVPTREPRFRISNPIPDLLYGYDPSQVFHGRQSRFMYANNEIDGTANNLGLMFPFLVVEFKGDGPTGGGTMWVAANQCLGASASCVHLIERLNDGLRRCKRGEGGKVNSAAFSLTINCTEARLFVSWKDEDPDQALSMQHVKSFLLHDPEQHANFRQCVRNIVDWGEGQRLREIRDCLDMLLEGDQAG